MEIAIMVLLTLVAVSVMYFSERKFTRAQQKEQTEAARLRRQRPKLAYQEELHLTWE
jgi:CHASE3 domain sensor protein